MQMSINWRYGHEIIHIVNYGIYGVSENSIYKSLGVGIADGINYEITKRIFLGFDIGYYHFFEKPHLGNPNNYPEYKPNRDLLIGNLKLGYLF